MSPKEIFDKECSKSENDELSFYEGFLAALNILEKDIKLVKEKTEEATVSLLKCVKFSTPN